MANAQTELNELRGRYFEGQRSILFHLVDADGPSEIVQMFVSNGGHYMEQTNGSGFTLLLTAALFSETPDMLRILLGRGSDIAAKCENGFTALHIAAIRGKTEHIDLLAQNGAPLEIEDGKGRTPIMLATSCGVLAGVQTLTGFGADVGRLYQDGSTALHQAVQQNRLDIAMVLMRARSDLTARFNGETPLELALSRGHFEMYNSLVSFRFEKALQTAILNDVTDDGIMSWFYSVESGARDVGGVALCMAIFKRSEAWVKALLNHSVDARSYAEKARIGCISWLTYALQGSKPSTRVIRLMMEAGVSVDTPAPCQWNHETPSTRTPIEFLRHVIENAGSDKDRVSGLQSVLRLFQQAPAVHAMSWVWPSSTTTTPLTVAGKRLEKNTSAIVGLLPFLKKSGKNRRVLAGAFWRYSHKDDAVFLGDGEQGEEEGGST